MNHTPAPWKLIQREVMEDGSVYPAHIVGSVNKFQVCLIETPAVAALHHSGKWPEAERFKDANAHLIAAAPDLLSEVKNLRRAYVNLLESGRDRILLLGGQCDDVATMEAADPNLRKTDAAIKKAEGQS